MSSSSQMKVAIISSLTGGLGHYCAHLAEPLSKHCHLRFITYPQVDLTGTVVKQITDSFVRKYVKWPRFDIDEANPKSIITIREYIQSRDMQIINVHVGTTVKRKILYFTTLLNYIKHFNNVKIIFTLHDVLPFDDDREITKLLKMFYTFADHFSVGNNEEEKKLKKYFGIPQEKITIIPHGIYNLFDRNIYSKSNARNFLGIPKNAKVVLFFGFLREYKGLEHLIKAAKNLKDKDKDVIIYVATGLKFASKDLIEKNLATISKLGLQETVMLNMNYLDTLDIEAVFKSADVVALPYTHASQSGVLMMALGFKKPVVITDAFYDKVWVDKKAGLVAKAASASSLAEKLNDLLSDEEMAKRYGEYGYEYASKTHNWSDIAAQYANMYNNILSHGHDKRL